MNEKKLACRKPHEIQPSPCDNCKKNAKCPMPCEEWRQWVRDVWPVVTGRRPHHG